MSSSASTRRAAPWIVILVGLALAAPAITANFAVDDHYHRVVQRPDPGIPGVHSRPLSDTDPDIAPDLVPLRQKLMEMVQRPVNIQASREIVMQVRGDLIGQPYLELFRKPEGLSLNGPS